MPIEQYGECREDYGDHSNEVVREVLTYLIPRFIRIEKFLLHLEKIEMSNQDKLDALAAKITQYGVDQAALIASQGTLIATVNDLSAEIAALKAANPDLDFTAIDAAADAADAAAVAAKADADKAITNNPDPGPQPPATGVQGAIS